MDGQHSQQQKERGVVPAAKGLVRLSWPQVEMLDRCINDVCEAGHGEVVVTIKRGVPFFISPRPSLRLQQARGD